MQCPKQLKLNLNNLLLSLGGVNKTFVIWLAQYSKNTKIKSEHFETNRLFLSADDNQQII